MRPRRLEVTAFGPYAGTVRIDFDDLADAGLFLVHGPTGAGKTSLLDAMTYALYGGVSGTRRHDRLRSDHADPHVTTTVAFEFCLRGRDYRVTRMPPHERAKKTGAGTTRQKPKATLSERRDGGWEPVAEGVEDVGDLVLDLVGLSREQFQQVVILPQGDFARALQADAHQRRRLLSSLFRTERFEAYTQSLVDRAKACEEALVAEVAQQQRCRGLLADRWRLVAGLDSADAEPPAPDRIAAVATARADAARLAAEQTAAAARHAAEELDAAKAHAERVAKARAAQAVLAQFDEMADEVADARNRLDRAERAEPLAPYLLAVDGAEAALDQAASHRDEAAAALTEQLGSAAAAVVGSIPALLPDGAATAVEPVLLTAARDELQITIVRLADLADRAQCADDHAAAVAAHSEAAAVHEQAAAQAAADVAALQQALDDLQRRRESACRAAERLEHLATEHQRLECAAQAAQAAHDLSARCDVLDAHVTAAKTRLNDALDVHRRLLEARIDGMTAELAAALVDGVPCGVCGSTDHPDPATGAAATIPVADVDAAAAATEAARVDLQRCVTAHDDMRRELLEALAASGGKDAAELAAEAATRADDLAAAETAAAALPSIDEDLRDLRAAIDRAADDRTQSQLAAAAETTNAQAAQRQAAAIAAEVAAVLGDDDAAETLQQARAVAASLDDLCAASSDHHRAATELRGAQWRLAAALDHAQFQDADAAREAIIPAPQRAALREQLRDLDQRRAAAAAVADDAVDDEAERPDLAALQAAADEAGAAATAAAVRLGVVGQAADDIADLAREWTAGDAAVAHRREDADRLRRLADVCSGTGNAQRMSLERYVLAAYFEEIADAASQRLQAMSDGRYTLHHSDERTRGGGASGLSITVHDAFTGTEREAGSLSGGETFQASLCLALGVAEVVQRHAGGVHLDTLFVDEGFGSLDAEALEQAMAELDALREGGRLVGIISHVPALRERITSGIAVTKTASGSDARVVVLAEA